MSQHPPLPLAVALQFYAEDMPKALRLARFLADLETDRRDDVGLIFSRRFDVPMCDDLWKTGTYCSSKFNVAHIVSDRERVGHPDGCFDLWAGTAEQCYQHSLRDWKYDDVLFIEPDGVPTRRRWLSDLQTQHAETLALGKRITGSFMQGNRYHCSHVQGTHIMRLSCWADHASLHACRRSIAWDLMHASVFLAESSRSSAISNLYGARNVTPEMFDVIGRESAWLPSAKDDSAWQCAQALLPSANPTRLYRAVFTDVKTGQTVYAMPDQCAILNEVKLPTKMDEVPDVMIGEERLRDLVGKGAVKLDVEQLDYTTPTIPDRIEQQIDTRTATP